MPGVIPTHEAYPRAFASTPKWARVARIVGARRVLGGEWRAGLASGEEPGHIRKRAAAHRRRTLGCIRGRSARRVTTTIGEATMGDLDEERVREREHQEGAFPVDHDRGPRGRVRSGGGSLRARFRGARPLRQPPHPRHGRRRPHVARRGRPRRGRPAADRATRDRGAPALRQRAPAGRRVRGRDNRRDARERGVA